VFGGYYPAAESVIPLQDASIYPHKDLKRVNASIKSETEDHVRESSRKNVEESDASDASYLASTLPIHAYGVLYAQYAS